MNQAREKQIAGRKKRPDSQTQSYGIPLATEEGKTCAAYLSAMGCTKDASGWSNPPGMELPDNFVINDVSGIPTAIVKGKSVSGYHLVTWLVLGSSLKGLNLIKMGALVLLGIHDIRRFEAVEGFDANTPGNNALKVMNVVAAAARFFPGLSEETETTDGPIEFADDMRSQGDIGSTDNVIIPETACPEGDCSPKTADDHESNGAITLHGTASVTTAPGEVPNAVLLDSHTAAMPADNGHPLASSTDSDAFSSPITDADIKTLLNAFNGDVMSEDNCITTGRRQAIEQFCHEIQLGRLLILKKQELKITALFKKWKAEKLPEAVYGKAVISRCTRYGMYEKRMKSKRGLLLHENDVKNCTKKAMLLIGGYKKKNVDALVNAVCAKLDSGQVVNEKVATRLVHKFRKKLEPRTAEAAQPPVPTTVQELLDLPRDRQSPYAKKHSAEVHEFLDALQQIEKTHDQEAAVVLPLVRLFTIVG